MLIPIMTLRKQLFPPRFFGYTLLGQCRKGVVARRRAMSQCYACRDRRALYLRMQVARQSMTFLPHSYAFLTSAYVALTGIANQRVNQVLSDPYGDKSITGYFNPRAFALPATGTLGNIGVGSIRGPGTWRNCGRR